MSPAIRIAALVSLLVHALVFSIPLRERESPPPAQQGFQGPLAVRLEPLGAPEPAVAEPEAVRPAPTPHAPRHVLAMPPRDRTVAPVQEMPPPPAEVARAPEPEPAREPAFDMAALIAANRERRRAWETAMARGAQRGTPPEAGVEALARNLASIGQGDGTGGVFQILRIGARSAEFSFRGWTTQSRRNWRQVIEVDAGAGGDVERAVVRRMIALIREHYSGDFRWDSQRLGRVVVLSAAPEHNEELEGYLLREFFGTPLVSRGR